MINEQAAMLKMSSLSYGWSNEQAAMLEMSSLSLWWSRRLCWWPMGFWYHPKSFDWDLDFWTLDLGLTTMALSSEK